MALAKNADRSPALAQGASRLDEARGALHRERSLGGLPAAEPILAAPHPHYRSLWNLRIFFYRVFALCPAPITPARGKTAFSADLWILVPAVIGLMLLTFYVVDAIRLNSNFIRIITGGVKEGEPEISERRG